MVDMAFYPDSSRPYSFRDADHMKGIAAMRIIMAQQTEQRHLVLLYQGLVLPVIGYAPATLTLCHKQVGRLGGIQNESICIILGSIKGTTCAAMCYLLDFPTMEDRTGICREHVFLRVSCDKHHPLHKESGEIKRNLLKRGKSWMGQAEDLI